MYEEEYEENIDCPYYGRQVELVKPWRGYHRGTIIGYENGKFIIQFSSGAAIDFYEDEFEFD